MEQHLKVVAVLHIVLGGLGVLGAAAAFIGIAGAGFLSGDLGAIAITSGLAVVIGLFLLILAVPQVVAGLGLLQRRSWARILALVVAAFELFHVPAGTALGIYTFWVLLSEETARLFAPAP